MQMSSPLAQMSMKYCFSPCEDQKEHLNSMPEVVAYFGAAFAMFMPRTNSQRIKAFDASRGYSRHLIVNPSRPSEEHGSSKVV